MFIKGRETPMTKNEIAKSEKTMFPDILKKSNFLISSVYRASLLENKVLALALTKVRLSDQRRPVATLRIACNRECNGYIFEGCGYFSGGTYYVY